MREFLLDPPGISDIFLDSLNVSYGGWGDRELFDWCFTRHVGVIRSQLLICRVDGVPAYGTAIHYRNIIDPAGEIRKVAMLGSGWTLPEFRGRGLSTEGIRKSLEIAAGQGCSGVVGFVRKENPSRGNMERNGALMMDARYYTAGGDTAVSGCSMEEIGKEKALLLFEKISGEALRDPIEFRYSVEEWSSQFMDRPGFMRAFDLGGGSGFAVLRDRGEQFSLQYLALAPDLEFEEAMGSLMSISHSEHKELFVYSTLKREWDVLDGMGFSFREGYMALFHPDDRSGKGEKRRGSLEGPWKVNNGDRM